LNWAPLKFITIILISFIFYYYKKYEDTKNSLINIGYWLLIWGAIWNAIGRIFQNGVIDFIWIKYFSVFNIADIAISAGILLLIYIHYAKWYITPNRD
jgi:signal peptidase II